MTDLITFLRARLDARERHIEFVRDWIHETHQGEFLDPDHELREVEAKRRTLARHAGCGLGTGWCDDGGHGWDEELGGGCPELGDMALPYASHPDYDERWKP